VSAEEKVYNELMKVIGFASDELFGDERSDLAGFDQNDAVRILHFAFDEQKCTEAPARIRFLLRFGAASIPARGCRVRLQR
jgi:hypothetical protein